MIALISRPSGMRRNMRGIAMESDWRQRRTVHRRACVVVLVTLFLVDCGVVPRDSAGALDRVRGGELRVGVVNHPPWVRVGGDQITGTEPELIERWAQQLDARVTWRPGVEVDLLEALHRRELDVLAAGLRSDSPHGRQVAFTRPYLEIEDRYGANRKHVLAVMPGERALLLSLDRFLACQDRAALRQQVEQHRRAKARQP